MTDIIKPGDEKIITIQMKPDMAKGLASILGEYAMRITMPEFKEELTEDQKTEAGKVFEERKKFATAVAQSLWKEAHK
ncbi:MAG: hypothetical protein EBX52_12690 [Proteobacteria bacterium]|nr:hypothetical protein [Pseudomonadota bacterium]